MPVFGSQIDTSRIPIRGLRPEESPTAPAAPVDGLLWRDTTENRVKLYLGGSWYYLDNQAIRDTEIHADHKDGAPGAYSLRTLGFGASQALAGDTTLDEIFDPVAPLDLNSQRIINAADPADPQDVVTKSYADTLRAGLRLKDAVRVATTANITLSGVQTIDGVAAGAGDRVLVKEQTDGAANGIYIVASGAWTRAVDADEPEELNDGATVFVQQGDTLANSSWSQINTITALTDAQNWSQQSAQPTYNAGAGLVGTGGRFGTVFDVVAADGTITVNADSIEVELVPVDKGGTNARNAYDARKNLGAMGRYAADLPALAAGAEVAVTHGLGSTDVTVSFLRLPARTGEFLDYRVIDADTVGVTAHVAYTAASLRVVVTG